MSTEKESKKTEQEHKNEKTVDSLTGKAREVWLAGLGALASVEEEGNKVFSRLVEKGTAFEERGRKKFDETYSEVSKTYSELETKLKSRFSKAEGELDENLQELIHKMGVPTQEEIGELNSQVEKLIKKVDELSKKVEKSSEGKTGGSKSTESK
ncbi:MAG: phasin family protein [Cyclonatronaceae bacterium]